MTNEDTPYLGFLEYRCALACRSLNEPSESTGKYGINPATDEQKNLVFGVARFTDPLFTRGINNIRFALFHDDRTGLFILAFHSTKTLHDWVDNIQQFTGQATELYQQAKEVASKIRPELRDRIIFTGHSLGGGLAIVAALADGARAVVFNPPRIHQNTIAGLNANDSRITCYRVKGDIASIIHWPPNHVDVGRETKLTPLPFASLHSMGQVIAGLRKEFAFPLFLIDAIVEILKPRVSVNGDQLRQSAFDLVQGKPVRSNTLRDLLQVEYRVEQVDAASTKVVVSVMYRKDQTSAELIETESDWRWEDLADEFRDTFIRTREKSLVYSLYKHGQ